MTALLQDFRYSLRALRWSAGFALAVVTIFSAGVGIAVPVLSLVEGGLLRTPDYANPPEILGMETTGGLTGWSQDLLTPAQAQTEHLGTLLTTLLVFALFVLAITTANIAILLLARANTRRLEMAVRATVGGRPGRLARQLFTEGAVLGIVGGGLGLLLGLGGIALLRSNWPAGLPLWLGMLPAPRATAASIGIPLAALLLCALSPGFVAWRRDLRSTLTTGRGATATPAGSFLRDTCVVLSVAATTLLLTSAALLFRATTPDISESDAGANSDEILTLTFNSPDTKNTAPEELSVAHEALLERISLLPGVRARSIASAGTWVGLGVRDRANVICGSCSRANVFMPIITESARHHVVGPSYFDTVGVAIASGREFTEADRVGAPGVAIVNEAFRTSFERADPIGRKIQIGGPRGEWYTIVGMVQDTHPRGIGAGTDPVPTVYFSALQHPPETVALAVRTTAGDPLHLLALIEGAVRSVWPETVISDASTLNDELLRFLAPLRWISRIFGTLAGLAVLLSTVALHGVISYGVRCRTREIGVRMALGGRSRQVRGMVVRQGLRLTLGGAVLGFTATIGIARLLQQLFFGVKVFDVTVYGSVGLLLAIVALTASLRPAQRAARVDPLVALSVE